LTRVDHLVNLDVMPSIHFLDVTNRDGVQTARTGLSKFGKVMVNFYLGRLGVAQSEIGFPFLFHEVPYVRACLALAEAGAFGNLRLSGWCRAVPADVEAAVLVQAGGVGLRHYNLSISTSDQMIAHKFRGKLDRAAIIEEMTAAVAVARGAARRAEGAQGAGRAEGAQGAGRAEGAQGAGRAEGAQGAGRAEGAQGAGGAGGAQEKYSIGVNAEDGSRTDDGYLLEFALAARDAGASRVRYCDTIGGDSPGRIRERFAKLASAVGIPVETHCHNDLGMAVANSVSGALGDLDAGQDAWINTCVNGIGERAGNADLLSCILAFRYGFGVSETATIGDPVDLSWARRFGLWAAYAFGQPLPPAWPGVGRNAFAHESGIHADGALKDRGNYELYDDSALGPFPSDWYAREGRVVLTGEYGGKAGFRHVLDGLGIAVAEGEEDLVFSLIQLCASATGKPLTDDELRLIAGYPRQLALLFPGLVPGH
jgi:isopropylmalate/homocitrate/citramalate synthase